MYRAARKTFQRTGGWEEEGAQKRLKVTYAPEDSRKKSEKFNLNRARRSCNAVYNPNGSINACGKAN